MHRAPEKQAGLALGAWGAVQATAVGVAMALSGALRDLAVMLWGATDGLWGLGGVATAYYAVYTVEIVLLIVTSVATLPLIRRAVQRRAASAMPESVAAEQGADDVVSGGSAAQAP